MTQIPVAIFKDEGNPVYGGVIPDLPGAVLPSGDTIAEAMEDSRDMVITYMECVLDEGHNFKITPSKIEDLRENPDYADAIWVMVDVDDKFISGAQTRFNVSWPEHLLAKVDAAAKAAHETRSGYLAKAASERLNAAL